MRIIRIALLLSLAVIAPGRIPSVEAKPVNFACQHADFERHFAACSRRKILASLPLKVWK